MLIFTLRRLHLLAFTILMLTLLSFSLSFLFPGDALINLTGKVDASPSELKQLSDSYLHQANFFYQYLAYLQHIFSGDFGVSMASQQPVLDEIKYLLPATMELSLIALFFAIVIGVPIGFIAAIQHEKAVDNIILTISMFGYSIPVFWLALFSILIFSITLGWLPSSGQISLLFEVPPKTGFLLVDILMSDDSYKWQAFQNAVSHMILPVFVIALAPTTIFIRLARKAMLEVLDQSYIKAAKAKGLSFTQIIFRHAFKNAYVKVVRDVGLQFANLVTMAMVTEVIFNWPGIGQWLIDSIYLRDYTAIQGGLLVLSSFIFIVHIITDFVYATLNPLAREYKHGS